MCHIAGGRQVEGRKTTRLMETLSIPIFVLKVAALAQDNHYCYNYYYRFYKYYYI